MKEHATSSMKRESDISARHFPFEVVHIGEPANNMNVFHWHEFMEISYIQDGQGIYEIEDKVFPVKKGDIVFINGIEKHRVTYRPGDILYETVIHFDPRLIWSKEDNPLDHSYLKLFSKGAGIVNRPQLSQEDGEIITSLISDIVCEYVQQKPYCQLMIKSKLLTTITHLLRQGGTRILTEVEVAVKRNNIDRLEKILDFIKENFTTDLGMDQVARKFFMNASYFSEYFKKNIGINFSDYLARLRINEAIKLLQENRLTSIEIAFSCGFNNTSSFYNAFKKITGTNPGSYGK